MNTEPDGVWPPEALGSMLEAELCPPASAAARSLIALRNSQQMEVKTSAFYRCPHCGARESVPREVQRRSLDEPAAIVCVCVPCGREFQGG